MRKWTRINEMAEKFRKGWERACCSYSSEGLKVRAQELVHKYYHWTNISH